MSPEALYLVLELVLVLVLVLELVLELELVPGLVIHHHHHRPRGLPRLRQERKLGRGCGAQRQLAQES